VGIEDPDEIIADLDQALTCAITKSTPRGDVSTRSNPARKTDAQKTAT
jgi:hypothetical protein